jgi:hypothetical protein
MFADMAAVASNDTADTHIPVNLSAAALGAILPAVYTPHLDFAQLRSRLDTISVAELFEIDDFFKLYDLDTSSPRSMGQILLTKTEGSPLLVFAEASKRDDLAMAKQALSMFSNKARLDKGRDDIEQWRYDTFAVGDRSNAILSLKSGPRLTHHQGVEPRYLFELLRLRGTRRYLKISSVTSDYRRGMKRVVRTDWSALSHAFDPHRK